jgi:hypothetical protein
MAISYVVATQWLLFRLSHPVRARLIFWPLMIAARRLERQFLRLEPTTSNWWTFHLLACEPRGDLAPRDLDSIRAPSTAQSALPTL